MSTHVPLIICLFYNWIIDFTLWFAQTDFYYFNIFFHLYQWIYSNLLTSFSVLLWLFTLRNSTISFYFYFIDIKCRNNKKLKIMDMHSVAICVLNWKLSCAKIFVCSFHFKTNNFIQFIIGTRRHTKYGHFFPAHIYTIYLPKNKK